MANYQLTLPAFPLKNILLPGEATKLHIFEERYKELVNDCLLNEASFAIPYVEDGKVANFGCEVKIKNVLKQYKDGRMDILVECQRVFKLLEFTEVLSPKLYGAALIEAEETTSGISNQLLQDAIIHYFSAIQNKILDYETVTRLNVYNVAASLQLSPQEKIELVKAKDKQLVLLNQIKFIMHIIHAEQNLNNRFMFN